MRLDLIVPHYKEPWETCKYLFDSIALQRGIDMDAIKVIVVNDGDCLLDEGNFQNYPYKIEYLVKEHGGVSAARNYGLDHSDAPPLNQAPVSLIMPLGFSRYGAHRMLPARTVDWLRMSRSVSMRTSRFMKTARVFGLMM